MGKNSFGLNKNRTHSRLWVSHSLTLLVFCFCIFFFLPTTSFMNVGLFSLNSLLSQSPLLPTFSPAASVIRVVTEHCLQGLSQGSISLPHSHHSYSTLPSLHPLSTFWSDYRVKHKKPPDTHHQLQNSLNHRSFQFNNIHQQQDPGCLPGFTATSSS